MPLGDGILNCPGGTLARTLTNKPCKLTSCFSQASKNLYLDNNLHTMSTMPTDKFAINDSSDDNPLISISYPRLNCLNWKSYFSERHTPIWSIYHGRALPQVAIDLYCEFPGKLTLEENIWLLGGPKIDKTAEWWRDYTANMEETRISRRYDY